MSERKVLHRRRLAIDDIAGHSRYIAESSLDSALHFLDAIEVPVDMLCQFPKAGGAVPTTRSEADRLRAKLVNGFGNYVILHFVTEETIDNRASHTGWTGDRPECAGKQMKRFVSVRERLR